MAFADAGHYVLEDKHIVLVPLIREFLQDTAIRLTGCWSHRP